MTKDRLAELQHKVSFNDVKEDKKERAPLVLSQNNISPPENYGRLHQCLDQVACIKDLIAELQSDVDNIKVLHWSILSSPIPNKWKTIELDDLMTQFKTSAQIIRAKLKEMENASLRATEEDKWSTLTRIQKTQYSALLRNFFEVIDHYQLAEEEYREKCKARIKRQLEISGVNLPEHEFEKILEQNNWSHFSQGLIMETEQAKQILADVEFRHDDIIKLEKSLKELHGLFLEMSLLVDRQGDVIDRIETNVISARDHVTRADEQLQQAHVLQIKTKKKKIKIILIFVLLIFALLLIVSSWFVSTNYLFPE